MVSALHEGNNTLGVAPTGFGKTIVISAVAGRLNGPGLILQHRDELVGQNARAFLRVNPGTDIALFNAERKRWSPKGCTFGMIQSVARGIEKGSAPRLNYLMIDEAHHATSDTYLRVLSALRSVNPDLKVAGVTATPARGDKRGLGAVFSGVCDAVTLRELIESGHLVKPRTFVVDVGVKEALEGVRKLASDFDMAAVAEIMDHSPVNDRVVAEWKRVAGDRRTVIFAANLAHAKHVTEAFQAAGVAAVCVDGTMGTAERARALAAFDRGEFQVVVNVAVLTEGWDCQPVSCVVLLRPSSHRSTMMQMIGRGLRKLDPERYPGIVKSDCIVIDFGTSILNHGSIETDTALPEGGVKDCPQCQGVLPEACRDCPLCGFEFPREPVVEGSPLICGGCQHINPSTKRVCEKCGHLLTTPKEKGELTDFVLTEVDLFKQSPFAWEELWPGAVFMAAAFDTWAAVVQVKGKWFAVGGAKSGERPGVHLLAAGQERLVALASGDDWMRENADHGQAAKTKSWLALPPTDKQLEALRVTPMQAIGVTRYKAACLLTWRWSESIIRKKVESAG